MNENLEKAIIDAANVIASADVIFISAGAGMGVDSGLPDFRGSEGFWKAYPLLKKENLSFQDLANPVWFSDDPGRAWGFYGHRYNLYKSTDPHQGFGILQKWSASKKLNSFVFTTNVDGHFQKSGFSSDSVYECHGSVNYLQCSRCCTKNIWEHENLNVAINQNSLTAEGGLPKCKNCSEIARPNILMFGDYSWIPDRSDLQCNKYQKWKSENSEAEIVTIEMGAGKAIPTARHASESMNGKIVRINPRDSDGNKETISIPLGALEALELIDYALENL